MEIARTELTLPTLGYRTDDRLAEVGFGAWEGLSLDEIRRSDPDSIAARERDKWRFTPPDGASKGESYETMSLRVGGWYRELTRDTVAVAHGGTLRGLIVALGVMSIADAPTLDIAQGVVYLIADGRMTRYA